jgi:uncharacterized protein YndB with AHSA1/START domain
MPNERSSSAGAGALALLITRRFDAPAQVVYDAWTQPQHMREWWGPRGFVTLSSEMDLRVGGQWRVHSRSAEGVDHTEVGVMREVDPPRRLAFTHAWIQADGKPGPDTLVTIDFVEDGEATLVTFRQEVFDSTESRDGHEEGWSSSFELLDEYLARRRS